MGNLVLIEQMCR